MDAMGLVGLGRWLRRAGIACGAVALGITAGGCAPRGSSKTIPGAVPALDVDSAVRDDGSGLIVFVGNTQRSVREESGFDLYEVVLESDGSLGRPSRFRDSAAFAPKVTVGPGHRGRAAWLENNATPDREGVLLAGLRSDAGSWSAQVLTNSMVAPKEFDLRSVQN